MKKIFLFLITTLPFFVLGQNPRVFTVKCNVAQSGGGAGFWQVSATNINDPLGLYDATEIATGDALYLNDGGVQYKLNITTVVSAVGNSATFRVSNTGVTGISSVPTTSAVISRGTPNHKLLPWAANISDADNQANQEWNNYLIDSLLSSGGIDTSYTRNDSVFVVSGGVEYFTGLAGINLPQFLGSSITKTIGNIGSGADYNSVNVALLESSKYISSYDTTLGIIQVRLLILPGTQLNERVNVVGGNYSNIKITSAKQRVRIRGTSPGSLKSLFLFQNCIPPRIDSLNIVNNTVGSNSEYMLRYISCSNVQIYNTIIDSVRFGIAGSTSQLEIIRVKVNTQWGVPNVAGVGIIANNSSRVFIADSKVNGFDSNYAFQEATNASMVRDTSVNYTSVGIQNRGSFITAYTGEFRKDGVSAYNSDIVHNLSGGVATPGFTGLRSAVNSGCDIPFNKITKYGICFKDGINPPVGIPADSVAIGDGANKLGDGIYLPTVTKDVATDTIVTVYTSLYSRNDTVMTVSGRLLVNNVLATTQSSVQLTLPPGFTSDFTDKLNDITGTVTCRTTSGTILTYAAWPEANTTTDKIILNWVTDGVEATRQELNFNINLRKK